MKKPKDFDFTKLSNFQGSVLKPLKLPETYKSYTALCRKIIKLHMRCQEDQILFPEVTESIKKVALVLHSLGRTKFKDRTPENLLDYLEIMYGFDAQKWLEFKHQHMTWGEDTQVIVEEARERISGTRCAFCRVHLEFPSYIIRRNETQVLHKSRAIGIKCLRSQQAKLTKFLNSPQIVSALTEIETKAQEIAKV